MTVVDFVRRRGFADGAWTDGNSAKAIAGYRQWLAEGRAGPLDYLKRHQHLREHPHELLDGGGAGFLVVILPLPFSPGTSIELDPGHGWIARYARGRDYHKVMRRALTGLLDDLRDLEGPDLEGRALVDSAPVLERDLAVQAGLGWVGRNGLLLHPQLGSSLMIGSLLLSRRPDNVVERSLMTDHCGQCRACLDVCPTQALDADKGLDAGLCISTWSIEDDALPTKNQVTRWGNHLFGCDLCQDVCPWNSKAPTQIEDHPLNFREDFDSPQLTDFLQRLLADPDELLAGTALRRAGRLNLLRNGLVVAAVQGYELDDALLNAWQQDSDEAAGLIEWSKTLPKAVAQ